MAWGATSTSRACACDASPRFDFLGEPPPGPSLLKIFLDFFLVLWTMGLLVRHRYDFVHAHEEAVFFCLALQPIFRFRLVYDMHSSLPQQLENFRFTRSRVWTGLFGWFEDRALERCDAVITICPDLADYATGQGVDPSRHFLIENSILDPVRLVVGGDAPPGPATAAAAAPDPPGDGPLVVYAGTLEAYQGIDLLLEAFARLGERVPEARLLLLGGTPAQVERYRERSRALGLEGRCRFAGRVPQEEARRRIAEAAVQVSSRISGTNTPLKVYEQLASGTPLVATDVYSHRQVLNSEVAVLVEPEAGALAEGPSRACSGSPSWERGRSLGPAPSTRSATPRSATPRS